MTIPPLLQSRKFQGALVGTILCAIPTLFTVTDKTVSRADKETALEHFIEATAALFGVSIAGTAAEDIAGKRSAGTAALADLNQRVTQHDQNIADINRALPSSPPASPVEVVNVNQPQSKGPTP